MREDKQEEDKIGLVRLFINELVAEEAQKQLNLGSIYQRKMKESSAKVNEVIHYFQTENVREMNNLLKAAANVRSKLVGCKRKTRGKTEETRVEAQTGESDGRYEKGPWDTGMYKEREKPEKQNNRKEISY